MTNSASIHNYPNTDELTASMITLGLCLIVIGIAGFITQGFPFSGLFQSQEHVNRFFTDCGFIGTAVLIFGFIYRIIPLEGE